MREVKRIKILSFALLAICIAVAIFAIMSSKANAYSTTDFRPSVAINHDLEVWRNQIAENEQSIQFLENLIYDYENNGTAFSENIEKNAVRFNYLHDYVTNNRDNIEELTRLSYASYLAKTLLEDVVGSDIAANTLFKWGLVDFVMSIEDDSITQLLEDYYSAKSDLDNAISDEQRAEELYENAKIDVVKFRENIPALQNTIAYWEAQLPAIYDIEAEYGEAGESYLAGDGYFCHPLQDWYVSGDFGEERDGYYHKGLDMCTDHGSPIYAAADGEVFESGYDSGMGNYIKFVTDEGLVVTYMHCSQVFVPYGVRIHRGDNVALVGSTGDSTGPHLHFQVEVDGCPVNPLNYL